MKYNDDIRIHCFLYEKVTKINSLKSNVNSKFLAHYNHLGSYIVLISSLTMHGGIYKSLKLMYRYTNIDLQLNFCTSEFLHFFSYSIIF